MAGIPQSGLRAPETITQGTPHLRRPQSLRSGDGRPLRPDLPCDRARAAGRAASLRSRKTLKTMLTPVILSGGAGTRLWPLSRELYPKQLLALTGERTMIQQTALRLEGLGAGGPVVVCNEAHRFLVAEQLRQVGIEPQAIVLEPAGRNTAPAIALAAHAALKAAGSKAADDPLLLVLPADHVIRDVPAFHNAVHAALGAARQGQLVTFGIVPT